MRLHPPFQHKVDPGRAQKRIADRHGDAGQDRKGRQPVPPAPGIGAVHDRDPLHQRAKGDALHHRRDQRAAKEGIIPDPLPPLRLPAVFEGHAAKDQRQKHEDDGDVERGHHDRIGQREDGEQPAAAKDKPGFVAVPDRCDRIHHLVPLILILREREEDADAQIEPVKHDVDQHRKRDETRPDERKLKPEHPSALQMFAGGDAAGNRGHVLRRGHAALHCARCGRFAHQPEQVEDTRAEDKGIDHDEGRQ